MVQVRFHTYRGMLVHTTQTEHRFAAPAMHAAPDRGLVTIERCCLDFDGGGSDDDALLVLGVPPDRVAMAAIYEHPRASSAASPTPPLR